MKSAKRKRLKRGGWRVGDAGDFLGLSDIEAVMIDMRAALALALKARRRAGHVTQSTVAGRIGSSQSRVAKMEAADPSVSIDLLIRGLLSVGSTSAEVGEAIAKAGGLARS